MPFSWRRRLGRSHVRRVNWSQPLQSGTRALDYGLNCIVNYKLTERYAYSSGRGWGKQYRWRALALQRLAITLRALMQSVSTSILLCFSLVTVCDLNQRRGNCPDHIILSICNALWLAWVKRDRTRRFDTEHLHVYTVMIFVSARMRYWSKRGNCPTRSSSRCALARCKAAYIRCRWQQNCR